MGSAPMSSVVTIAPGCWPGAVREASNYEQISSNKAPGSFSCGFLVRVLPLLLVLFFSFIPSSAVAASFASASSRPETAPIEQGPQFPGGWKILEGIYTVVGGDPADASGITRVSVYGEQAVPRVARFLGLPAGRRINIFVAHTMEQFRDMQPGTAPAWAEATAWPRHGAVFLKAPRLRSGLARSMEQVLDHELTHVILGRAFRGAPVPRWLQEGLAQYVAREYTAETTRLIARGSLGKGLLDLRELASGFPDDPLRAQLAYAQSADLVAFLHNEFGPESITILVRRMASGQAVGASVKAATGLSLDQVDERWRSRLASSELWLPALVNDSTWWVLGALVMVLGALLVRRRNRRRLQEWEEEESLYDLAEYDWDALMGPSSRIGINVHESQETDAICKAVSPVAPAPE